MVLSGVLIVMALLIAVNMAPTIKKVWDYIKQAGR